MLLFSEANLTEDMRSIVLLLATEVVEVIIGEVDCSMKSQPSMVEVFNASSRARLTALSLFSFLSEELLNSWTQRLLIEAEN